MRVATSLVSILSLSLLATACGSSGSSTPGDHVDPTPTETPTVLPAATPTPAPTFPEGIYVALIGNDDADGAPERPLRTINEGIRRAVLNDLHDVWVIGTGSDTAYEEVVRIANGTNVHGNVCMPVEPPLRVDAVTCKTVVHGGSPTLIAEEIDVPTVVEGLEIRGLGVDEADAQVPFTVPGLGCRGRAKTQIGEPCMEPVDALDRTLPSPALAVIVRDSNALRFVDVKIKAGEAEAGLAGADGIDGANGPTGVAGGDAGDAAWSSGAGAPATVNVACPEANGGAGGDGGRFHSTSSVAVPTKGSSTWTPGVGYAGAAGEASAAGLAGSLGANPEFLRNMGWSAFSGSSAPSSPDAAIDGAPALDERIDASLAAEAGLAGENGIAGAGGGGAGGGAPGTRKLFEVEFNTFDEPTKPWQWTGNAGVTAFHLELGVNVGETAGGGGGAGGAGGCGGTAATPGQGGAHAVAVLLLDSEVTFDSSSVTSGTAGNGGDGAKGGRGGSGGFGGQPGHGKVRAAENVSGSYDANGTWVNPGMANFTEAPEGFGGSVGGHGGGGGNGQRGRDGGDAGGGAGGESIAVLLAGESSALGDYTLENGLGGGLGGDSPLGRARTGTTHALVSVELE